MGYNFPCVPKTAGGREAVNPAEGGKQGFCYAFLPVRSRRAFSFGRTGNRTRPGAAQSQTGQGPRPGQFPGGENMPNAKVLSEKQAIVAELTEKIQKATAGVIVDYKGITVEEDTALRRECRENAVDYAVVKNTLLRFAFNNSGLSELDSLLNGTTSLALCEDPVAPARIMSDYAKKLNDKFEIKGGFMDGKPVDLETIKSLASIPALPVLQAQVLGTMLAPITGLAVVLKQIAEKQGAPAAAEAE